MTKKKQASDIIRAWQQYPVTFMERELGVKMWSGMRLVTDSVWTRRRTSVAACHGISKTYTAAVLGVTFLNVFAPSIVITTAPSHRQVKSLLWKEIDAVYRQNRSRLSGELTEGDADVAGLVGTEQNVQVKITPEWYMIGFSTDRATRVEGFHAPHILWILDEAKGLPQWLYDAIRGSMTGGFSRVLEISTTDGAGPDTPFRQHHIRSEGWRRIVLSAYDSPFVRPEAYPEKSRLRNKELLQYGKPASGREWSMEDAADIQVATEEWVDESVEAWHARRPEMETTKVDGRFAAETELNILPLDWVLSAVDSDVKPRPRYTEFGLDVARLGADRSVLTERQGGYVFDPEELPRSETMATVGWVVKHTAGRGLIKVDMIGVGAGVFDRLAELEVEVVGINSAASAENTIEYGNFRAEMWWWVRDLFYRQYTTGGVLRIPDNPELQEELTSVKMKIRSDGVLFVEPKEDIIKRLGRSPDLADSLIYCLARLPVER